MRAVDCQSFAGGMALGTVRAGFELVAKCERKGGFGVVPMDTNRHLLGSDWTIHIEDWPTIKKVDYVFGNPPCSGFSAFTNKEYRGVDAKVNECMWLFVRYAAQLKAPVIAFESVTPAYRKGVSLMHALHDELEELTGKKYFLQHVLHNNYFLGGVGWRPRYFWVASRKPIDFTAPSLSRLPTLRDAISDLEGLKNTPAPQKIRKRKAAWWAEKREDGLVDGHTWHESPIHERIDALLESETWEQGEALTTVMRRYYERHGEFPGNHNKDLMSRVLAKDFAHGFTWPIRWTYDMPARVINGGSMVLSYHPTENRFFSHRECARIMGFPDEWLIQPALLRESRLRSMWGKGISVGSGQWLAENVYAHLSGEASPHPIELLRTDLGDRRSELNVPAVVSRRPVYSGPSDRHRMVARGE